MQLQMMSGGMLNGEEEEEDYGCGPDTTGYVVLPGCTRYVWCQAGSEVTRFDCADGTLYDEVGGYCNWADQVVCDSTHAPTRGPAESPTWLPTSLPTSGPTELDLSGTVWYPDFSTGTCRSDGEYPEGVGREYLFGGAPSCCGAYFASNLDECLAAGALEAGEEEEALAPPAGEPEWYPVPQEDRCRKDEEGYHGDWLPLYHTYGECCGFEWIRDRDECLRQEPVIMFYPDYETDSCRNDGLQSQFEENLFESREECCRFKWIDYGLCILGGSGSGSESGSISGSISGSGSGDDRPEMQLNSAG